MERNIHPRVIGACVVGFAMVAGAYVLSNFGQSNFKTQPAAVVVAQPRVAIEVRDEDNNGIEDWRDEFITTAPIILDQATTTFEMPDSVTGQLGIDFIESLIRTKTAGPFGPTQDELVDQAVDRLTAEAVYELYDVPDIEVVTNWNEQDLLNYANTVALTIMNNNVNGGRGEIDILSDALRDIDPNQDYIAELKQISEAYKNMRDTALTIPVPTLAVKQHLDLVNTFHALHRSIGTMAQAAEDPALALVRIKRYQDDALGLQLALENMYLTLEPYAALVGPDDPALLFVLFSSEFNS